MISIQLGTALETSSTTGNDGFIIETAYLLRPKRSIKTTFSPKRYKRSNISPLAAPQPHDVVMHQKLHLLAKW